MAHPDTRSAAAALDVARPLIVRLDERRHPEDAAADLIEGWAAVETALRAMLGGSSLGGQALVSEARSRGTLDYPHAHALLGYLAARDRATRPDYQPSAEDVAAARAGFQAIEAANGAGIGAMTGVHPTVSAASAYGAPLPTPTAPTPAVRRDGAYRDGAQRDAPPVDAPRYDAPRNDARRTDARLAPPPSVTPLPDPSPAGRRSPLLLVGLGALALLLAAGAYWAVSARGGARSPALDDGVAAFSAGRRDEARRLFATAAADDPASATPHVYLARMAREENNLQGAAAQLDTAIRADSRSALALREMGMLQLQANQTQLAIRFFARALEIDPSDRVSAGWTACALSRQGNVDIAQRFYGRAGPGDWDACRQAAPSGAPGAAPPRAGVPGAGVPAVPPNAGGRAPLARP